MEIYNHTSDDHLYDDLPHYTTHRTDSSMVELNQGRDQKHQERLLANVYYTFLTAGTLLIAYGIYKLYEILLNSI